MNTISHLRRRWSLHAGARVAAGCPTVLPQATTPAVDHPLACGWFESSHDLSAGLHVTEHGDVDAVLNQFPAPQVRQPPRLNAPKARPGRQATERAWAGDASAPSCWQSWAAHALST